MIGTVLWGAGLLGQWGLGIVLAEALLGRRSPPATDAKRTARTIDAEVAGLGLVLGIGGTTWILFVWSLLGGPLGRPASLVLAIAGLLCGTWRVMRVFAPIPQSNESAGEDDPSDRSLALVCRSLLIVLSIAAAAQVLLTPQRLWDERATFGMRAAVLFEDQTVWSPDLLDPDYVIYHPRYPLLLSLSEQHLYALLGRLDDRLSKILFPLLYAGMCLCFAGVLSRSRSPGQAWLWAAVLGTVSALLPHEYGFLSGQADAPMACFHGLSVLYLWNFWIGRTGTAVNSLSPARSASIAGLLAGLAAFTKDEGLAFLLVDAGLLAGLALLSIFANRQHRLPSSDARPAATKWLQPWLVALIYVGAACLILGPWFYYRRHLPLTTEMNYFGRFATLRIEEQVEPILWMVRHFGERMFFDPWEWGWQWGLMLAAAVLVPARMFRFSSGLLLGDIAGALLGLMTAGLLAPVAMHEHIGGSSDRFLMQLAPLAILFAAGQLTCERNNS